MVNRLLRILNVVLIMLKSMECEAEIARFLHVFPDKVFSNRFKFKILLLKCVHHVTIFGQVEIPNDKQILNLVFVLGHFGF